MIVIENVTKRYKTGYGWLTALEGVSLTLDRGEIVSLIGPSGCGKTTLLNILAGVLRPDAGWINWGEEFPAGKRPVTGLVLQNYGLFPWKTVWHNTLLAMDIQGIAPAEKRLRAERVLREMDLLPFKDYFPDRLSGGQRQRVALARAFAAQPTLMLLDEPFSALDAFTREELQDCFLRVWRERTITTLLVTHSLEEAIYLGQRIGIMGGHPGRLRKMVDNPYFGRRPRGFQPEMIDFMERLRTSLLEGGERSA